MTLNLEPIPASLYPWEKQAIKRARLDLSDPTRTTVSEGVMHWLVDGAVVAPSYFRAACVTCPTEQYRAYTAYTRAVIWEAPTAPYYRPSHSSGAA